MGVKCSAVINSFLTGINLAVILLVIVVGFYFGKFSNWTTREGGFLPFGLSGVMSGAATCFYAYVGFDCIATSGEEAQEPAKSIPIATILAMSVVSLGKSLQLDDNSMGCADTTFAFPFLLNVVSGNFSVHSRERGTHTNGSLLGYQSKCSSSGRVCRSRLALG